jgi:hypothetical protein
VVLIAAGATSWRQQNWLAVAAVLVLLALASHLGRPLFPVHGGAGVQPPQFLASSRNLRAGGGGGGSQVGPGGGNAAGSGGWLAVVVMVAAGSGAPGAGTANTGGGGGGGGFVSWRYLV